MKENKTYSRCVFTRHSMYPKINKAMKHAKMCVKWEERQKRRTIIISTVCMSMLYTKYTHRVVYIGIGVCVYV